MFVYNFLNLSAQKFLTILEASADKRVLKSNEGIVI